VLEERITYRFRVKHQQSKKACIRLPEGQKVARRAVRICEISRQEQTAIPG
jgi:hypothetical protein